MAKQFENQSHYLLRKTQRCCNSRVSCIFYFSVTSKLPLPGRQFPSTFRCSYRQLFKEEGLFQGKFQTRKKQLQ